MFERSVFMSLKTKKFLSYYKPYKGLIIADLFFAFVTAVISIAIPYIISYITGTLITDSGINSENMSTIIWLIVLLFGLLAIEFGSQVFVTYMGHYTGTLMESDLRCELFNHYQKLSRGKWGFLIPYFI